MVNGSNHSSFRVRLRFTLVQPAHVANGKVDELTCLTSILRDINGSSSVKFASLQPQAFDSDSSLNVDSTLLEG